MGRPYDHVPGARLDLLIAARAAILLHRGRTRNLAHCPLPVWPVLDFVRTEPDRGLILVAAGAGGRTSARPARAARHVPRQATCLPRAHRPGWAASPPIA